MLANVVGVPLGAFAGQAMGWRGPFWALAALSAAAIALIARTVPHDSGDQQTVSIRSELTALGSGGLWLVLAACATTTGGVLAAYSYISPLLTDRSGIASGIVPLVLVGFGLGARRRPPGRPTPAHGDPRRRRGSHPPAPGDLPAGRLHRAHHHSHRTPGLLRARPQWAR
ncbi:MFS transporter [Streptomyces phaeochromogenes]